VPGTARGDESGTDSTPDLTDFQLEVARLFFSLPASKGFLLADDLAVDAPPDDEIPVPGGLPVSEVRTFYAAWRSDLMTHGTG
jgi:hypothetical protein